MKNAVWGLEYDYRTDKNYNCPSCDDCGAPVFKDKDGEYRCVSCGEELSLDDDMKSWFAEREGEKVEMQDCATFVINGKTFGCGGEKCVEVHFFKNKVTLEWETGWGKCRKCGKHFIV